jgi:hypothetical protein
LLRLLIHGDLGAVSAAWEGVEIRGEELCCAAGLRFKGADILAGPYLRELARALQRQL